MEWYFKRDEPEGVLSKVKLFSHESAVVGLISLLFFFNADGPETLGLAKTFICIFMGLSAVSSAIVLFIEGKQDGACNLYDLLRCIVYGFFSIMSVTFIDIFLL